MKSDTQSLFGAGAVSGVLIGAGVLLVTHNVVEAERGVDHLTILDRIGVPMESFGDSNMKFTEV